jgi:hypothetical protein
MVSLKIDSILNWKWQEIFFFHWTILSILVGCTASFLMLVLRKIVTCQVFKKSKRERSECKIPLLSFFTFTVFFLLWGFSIMFTLTSTMTSIGILFLLYTKNIGSLTWLGCGLMGSGVLTFFEGIVSFLIKKRVM